MCVCVCVCVCVCKFFLKDFSGTTAPRILKFGTNVGYDFLYCLKENQPPSAYHSFYVSIFLSLSNKNFHHRNLGSYESSNFVYNLRRVKFIVGKKSKML